MILTAHRNEIWYVRSFSLEVFWVQWQHNLKQICFHVNLFGQLLSCCCKASVTALDHQMIKLQLFSSLIATKLHHSILQSTSFRVPPQTFLAMWSESKTILFRKQFSILRFFWYFYSFVVHVFLLHLPLVPFNFLLKHLTIHENRIQYIIFIALAFNIYEPSRNRLLLSMAWVYFTSWTHRLLNHWLKRCMNLIVR